MNCNKLNGERNARFSMITGNQRMKKVFSLAESIAKSDISLMITGETGVGKSMFSSTIHNLSSRWDGPYAEINCGAIPENLIESELFGYVSGAFTGASETGKKGRIECACGGTLFLDEIGELSMEMQKKLLQVVQDKRLVPIGGTKYVDIDFRLITATNQDLQQKIRENKFREDLYYRINVVPIHIPPLRERKEDIALLTKQFLDRLNHLHNKQIVMTPGSFDMLKRYEWPGNIRELQNVIERVVIIAQNPTVDAPDLQMLFPEISVPHIPRSLKEGWRPMKKASYWMHTIEGFRRQK